MRIWYSSQHVERLTDAPQRTVCLQGSYSVRAAGTPKGSCICKWVGWLRAEIRAGKFEKMVTGSMYWKAEQSREKYGWREMGIRWLAREGSQQSTQEKFSESVEERKNLAQWWLTSRFFYTIQRILPKQNILAGLVQQCQSAPVKERKVTQVEWYTSLATF